MLHRLIGLIILIASFAIAWFMMSMDSFGNQPLQLPEQGVNYHLVPGTSVSSLAHDLEQKGYLDSALFFRLMARLDGQAHKLKAGEYHLPNGLTPKGLLALLVSGKVVSHTLTIVEGWSFKQLRLALSQHMAITQTLEGVPDQEVMARLGHSEMHPEGRFLPDTYHFPRGTTDLEFLRRAYLAMEQLLAREWETREADLPLKSPYEP